MLPSTTPYTQFTKDFSAFKMYPVSRHTDQCTLIYVNNKNTAFRLDFHETHKHSTALSAYLLHRSVHKLYNKCRKQTDINVLPQMKYCYHWVRMHSTGASVTTSCKELCVCGSAWNNSASNGLIFVKFYIHYFSNICQENPSFIKISQQ